jgi:hypothetical protein
MIFMRLIALVIALLVLLATPALASDVRPGFGDSFNGSTGVLTGNSTLAPTNLPVQLPGPGIAVLGTGVGGSAD